MLGLRVPGQQAEEVELGAEPVHISRQHLLTVAARHLDMIQMLWPLARSVMAPLH